MPRSLLFVVTLQCALAVVGVAQSDSDAPRQAIGDFLAELHEPTEKQDLLTQTLLWSIPHHNMPGQPVPFYAEWERSW